MFAKISVCVAVLLLSGLSEQDELNGPCSRFGLFPLPFFASDSLIGDWYLFAAYDEGLPLHESKCIRFTNAISGFGTRKISTTEVATNIETGEFTTNDSTMTFTTLGGRYTYATDGVSEETQIVVAAPTFYIEYGCVDVDGKAKIYIGVFTRAQAPTPLTIGSINAFLTLHQIDPTTLRSVDHTSCTYAP